MSPDIKAYTAAMEEIKRRTTVVFALLNQDITLIYRATHVESMVLQIRMITELVALASLAANKPIFEENKKKFDKHWHPSKILQDVERLNPNFYPQPIREIPSKNQGVKDEIINLDDGFMTRDELVEVHGRCGNLLHAQNPFGKGANYEFYEKAVPKWMSRIMKLLNNHTIRLLGDDRFYLVHMKEERDDRVHMYTFERVDT
jgi:hypothetical protein